MWFSFGGVLFGIGFLNSKTLDYFSTLSVDFPIYQGVLKIYRLCRDRVVFIWSQMFDIWPTIWHDRPSLSMHSGEKSKPNIWGLTNHFATTVQPYQWNKCSNVQQPLKCFLDFGNIFYYLCLCSTIYIILCALFNIIIMIYSLIYWAFYISGCTLLNVITNQGRDNNIPIEIYNQKAPIWGSRMLYKFNSIQSFNPGKGEV